MLVFSFIYFITPDVKQRSWRWVTPGAVAGVVLWLLASWGFSTYLSTLADVGAIYGAFTGAMVLVAWMWLTNVACYSAPSSTPRSNARRRYTRACGPVTR